uniref:ATP-binding protein n=1 Tax=Desulfatirhabdium butyrativorans TaxID=340467 RepID=A0A7C4RSV7_9BACT
MEKQFNTAGPCEPDLHYMLDPLKRFDLEDVLSLIETRRYFVLHAPRQTGKTTSMLALMRYLNANGRFRALYANIETAQTARNDVASGAHAMVGALIEAARFYLSESRGLEWLREAQAESGPNGMVAGWIRRWTMADPRPAVLLLDEVDALVGDTLVSLLRQLRGGYPQRPAAFPQSIILCGVRDVRDYRIHTGAGEIITGGSAFNIKAKSLRLGNFTQKESILLWQQHEEATGQRIDPAVWDELWTDTCGQPWLVNALGLECTWEDRELRRNRSLPITLERYKAARERLIENRSTHLDQLTDKLQEERVRRVITAILAGEDEGRWEEIPLDDQRYTEDLGLIVTRPEIAIANRLYAEVIPRELIWTTQTRIAHDTIWYVDPEGRLDMPKLLTAFQQFFREHSDAWIEGFSYREAGPQLLMQAFLQRIVNGGGRISREYALGRRRTDLFIEWPIDKQQAFYGPVQKVVIELKVIRKGDPMAVLPEALTQTSDYADRVGAGEAYLLIFDRRGILSWDRRCWQRYEHWRGRTIGIWGA